MGRLVPLLLASTFPTEVAERGQDRSFRPRSATKHGSTAERQAWVHPPPSTLHPTLHPPPSWIAKADALPLPSTSPESDERTALKSGQGALDAPLCNRTWPPPLNQF
jgi:hypothetical protein